MRCAIALRLAVARGAGDVDLGEQRRAFAVGDDLRRQVAADGAQRECERLVARRRALDLRDAGGEQHDRVVRRAFAVDRDRVEARLDRGAEERDRVARLERIVGRDDGEHRREVRVDHPRALGHAADREAGPVCDGRLRLRVGGENRLRRIAAAVCRECSGRRDEALLDPLERQRRADHAGREHEHLLRRRARAAQRRSRRSRRASASPCAPVAAFATPELITTACGCVIARWRFETVTGAAWTRFCVHIAAPVAGAD